MIPLPLGAIYPVLIVIAFEVIMGYAWANNASSKFSYDRLGLVRRVQHFEFAPFAYQVLANPKN